MKKLLSAAMMFTLILSILLPGMVASVGGRGSLAGGAGATGGSGRSGDGVGCLWLFA